MPFTAAGYAAELAPLESTDPVVQAVAKNVRAAVKDSGIEQEIPDLKIYFPDFSKKKFEAAKPAYYTEGCQSILPSIVVVNASFLLDTEAAIRSFGLYDELFNTPYLRNDACMFGLVKRVREEGNQWLYKLRELEQDKKSTQRSSIDELTLTILFFCAHEIGHLKDGIDAGQFVALLNPAAPFENRSANAAVKLRRHATEFQDYGFDLPGWKGAVDPQHEVFAATEKLRQKILEDDEKNVDWFKKEISADEAAVKFMIHYLKDQEPMRRWLLIRGLFGASLYAWYDDFLTFCERMNVPRMGPKPMLSFELMKNPEIYIRAASLFGDVHRTTILRSTLAIQRILNADVNNGAEAQNDNTFRGRAFALWNKLFGEDKAGNDESEQQWKAQSARRHLLLAIHMDTVVKLAYVGASMPWIKEKNPNQIMLIEHESIDQSVGRLKEMMNKQLKEA